MAIFSVYVLVRFDLKDISKISDSVLPHFHTFRIVRSKYSAASRIQFFSQCLGVQTETLSLFLICYLTPSVENIFEAVITGKIPFWATTM